MAENPAPPSVLKPLLIKSGSGFLSGGLGIVMAVAASVAVARTMGAAAQGEIHLMLTLNALVTFSTSFGVGLSNYAHLPTQELSLSTANRVALFVAGILGGGAALLGILLCALGFDFWGAMPRRVEWMAYVAVPFTMYASFWSSLMVGTNRVHLGFWGTSGLAYAGSIAIILSSVLIGTVPGVAWSWAATTGVMAVVLAIVARRLSRGDGPGRLGLLAEVKRAVGFGVSGYLGGVATLLWTRLDSWILSLSAGTSVVGIYSAATGIGDKVRVASTPLSYSLMYQVARLGKEEARRLTMKIAALCALALAVPVAVLAVGSPLLVRLLFGPAFAEAAAPLSILLVGAAFGCVAGCFTPYYVAQIRRPGVLSAMAWLTVLLELGGCALLIPRHGMIGAAWTTAGVQAVGLLLVVGLAPVLRSEDRP
jgi:O-antigen/teichoic acid export membrane protein